MRHDDRHLPGHTHGALDPDIVASERGIRAVKFSFVALCITALIQVYVVWISGSVALLADTIHNFGDAATALPLGVAFLLARRPPSRRFTYGYGRAEDLAGVVIVVLILLSAVVAGYQAFGRLLHPEPLAYPSVVAIAAIIGFIGNEAVAIFRIRVGQQIHSAALIADGHHARVDGWTSLAVLAGAAGTWLGYPIVDPIVGLLITAAIGRIVWQSASLVFGRLLDGVDPGIVDEIRQGVAKAEGIEAVSEVRARWLGHRLHAEINVAVRPELSVSQGHAVAVAARHRLLDHLPYLQNAIIHVDPSHASGEAHHRIIQHTQDEPPLHIHALGGD
jgi:cation diffusion facilitator family transporter